MTSPSTSSVGYEVTAVALRTVLTAIDSGEVAADDVQRAYIAGAADALEAVARPLDHSDPATQFTVNARIP